jgi:tetratricopeptide (TPR) repeat protein
MKRFLKKVFGSHEVQKNPLPEEYQVRIALNEFRKEQLIDIINKYILKSHHVNLIGLAFRNLKEFNLAEKNYLEAIELSPEYDEPYGNLLSLYITQKKYELCENIYRKGMNNANKKSSIMYQDGRLAFIKGNFEQSLLAARSILIDENMNDEAAFVLAVHSLLSLIKQQKDTEKNFNEAVKMWEMGISIFSESQSLKELSKHFKDHE